MDDYFEVDIIPIDNENEVELIVGKNEEPMVGMVFNSKEEVYEHYLNYAKGAGFGLTKRSSVNGEDGYCVIECSRLGKSRAKAINPLKSFLVTKAECKAKVRHMRK